MYMSISLISLLCSPHFAVGHNGAIKSPNALASRERSVYASGIQSSHCYTTLMKALLKSFITVYHPFLTCAIDISIV